MVKLYKGLIERTIEEGLNTVYPANGGWTQYWEHDYPRLNEIGRWISWPYNAQMYHGQSVAALDAFCEAECDKVYRKWYFVSSMKIWRALEAAGVVGPQEGSKPRQVLIGSLDELEKVLEAFRNQ